MRYTNHFEANFNGLYMCVYREIERQNNPYAHYYAYILYSEE